MGDPERRPTLLAPRSVKVITKDSRVSVNIGNKMVMMSMDKDSINKMDCNVRNLVNVSR